MTQANYWENYKSFHWNKTILSAVWESDTPFKLWGCGMIYMSTKDVIFKGTNLELSNVIGQDGHHLVQLHPEHPGHFSRALFFTRNLVM